MITPRHNRIVQAELTAAGELWVGDLFAGQSLAWLEQYGEMARHVPPGATMLRVCVLVSFSPERQPDAWRIAWTDHLTGAEGVIVHPTGVRAHVERSLARLNQRYPSRTHWAVQ